MLSVCGNIKDVHQGWIGESCMAVCANWQFSCGWLYHVCAVVYRNIPVRTVQVWCILATVLRSW